MPIVLFLAFEETPSPGDVAAGGAVLGMGFLFLLFVVFVSIGVYFIPSIIGFARHKTNAVAILALNFFLGWSLIGWVIALVWALANEGPPQQVVVYHQAGPPPAAPAQQPAPTAQNATRGLVNCPGCGTAIHESASACFKCGRQIQTNAQS